MTAYETASLVLQRDTYELARLTMLANWAYSLLTLGALCFVAFDAIIKPRLPDLVFYFQDYEGHYWDFVIENRGVELRNLRIESEPDYLGWNAGSHKDGVVAQSTSAFFKSDTPYLAHGRKKVVFWCDARQNAAVLQAPFRIDISFENPIPLARLFRRRLRRSALFHLNAFSGGYQGHTQKEEIHQLAVEMGGIRAELKRLNDRLEA